MSEKKTISKSVAIPLGIICIILAGSLVGTFAYYVPMINDKDNTISSLRTQISQLNSSVTSLQNQVNNLTDALNLGKSTVWVDKETVNLMRTIPYQGNVPYAGYVVVEVTSSQSNETIVIVRYSSHGVNYDGSISVGSGGTAIFPVLPSSNALIICGQTNPQFIDISQYATVTITYYW